MTEPIPEFPILTVGVDCFVTYEQAIEIADKTLFAHAWHLAAPERKALTLTTATGLLSRMRWKGRPSNASQKLAWPRSNVCDEYGQLIQSDAIPSDIAIATVELAIYLQTNGSYPGGPAVQMRQLGDALTMYFAGVNDELPKHVRRLIEQYLIVGSSHVAEVAF